jgi:glutaminase
MSVAKPFVFALVCEIHGAEDLRRRLGVNPRTGERVVDAEVCHFALAVMATSGLYETSGDWLYDVGVPGKGALATFAPPLDGWGNSVRGQLAARFLSRRLGLTLFASEPS